MNIEPRLSVRQLAEAWGVSRQHVYSIVQDGRLRCVKIGALIRFRPEDIKAYEASQCQDQNPIDQPILSPSAAISGASNGGKTAAHAGYHAALRTRAKRAASLLNTRLA